MSNFFSRSLLKYFGFLETFVLARQLQWENYWWTATRLESLESIFVKQFWHIHFEDIRRAKFWHIYLIPVPLQGRRVQRSQKLARSPMPFGQRASDFKKCDQLQEGQRAGSYQREPSISLWYQQLEHLGPLVDCFWTISREFTSQICAACIQKFDLEHPLHFTRSISHPTKGQYHCIYKSMQTRQSPLLHRLWMDARTDLKACVCQQVDLTRIAFGAFVFWEGCLLL